MGELRVYSIIIMYIPSLSRQINYAEIQHEATSGVKVNMGNDPVVEYTQVAWA